MVLPPAAISLELSSNHLSCFVTFSGLSICHSTLSDRIRFPRRSLWNSPFQPLSVPCPEPSFPALHRWSPVLTLASSLWTGRAHCLRCPLHSSAWQNLWRPSAHLRGSMDWRSFQSWIFFFFLILEKGVCLGNTVAKCCLCSGLFLWYSKIRCPEEEGIKSYTLALLMKTPRHILN